MQTDARNGTLSTTVSKQPSARRGARHNFLKMQHIRAQAFISTLDDRDSPLKVVVVIWERRWTNELVCLVGCIAAKCV